ncbi:carbohydrate ABC transporter permease [Caproiciproducens galactitolivorans]|uniref:L-arabinose transport system permease protein AraQ n=1 Tax=Caproiciproducens galactitolivorans TaxID=642589 RepID=A0A4Z0Y9D7_9FIRM|nr:carbohydrate ABC transporter permease [Caproiciproducens galactitolivorans]QEY34862.1 carbohydrate ABC transporter permease [Caproiciproducens galactitolivorans]TGJ75570.1 L-arabinose transport system permease protein AraQ [Caproiciproducens galactitolivorans]
MTNTAEKTYARRRGNGKRIQVYFVLIFLTLLCLIPFFILLINATRAHPDIQKGFSVFPGNSFFINLHNVLHNENLPVLYGIRNSLLISFLNALFATYFSAMTAFGLHAYEFHGKKLAFSFIMLIMMVPTQVYSLGFIRQMAAMGLKDSFIPLIVPAAASPTVVFFMKQYLISALPLEIVEAARIDGSSEFRTFNTVVLPMMKPAIAVQAIFTFVFAWNNYFLPALLLDSKNKKTLPILIAQLRSADFLKFDMGQVYMLITIAIIPIILVYLCMARFIVGGVTLGSVKG